MQNSCEQPLAGEDHCVTTLITAAKETTGNRDFNFFLHSTVFVFFFSFVMSSKFFDFESIFPSQISFQIISSNKLALDLHFLVWIYKL